MPNNCNFDKEEADEFINNGGISKNTKYAKEKAETHFMSYVESNFPGNDETKSIFEDKDRLENALIQYFSTYRKKNGDLPKKNTIEASKSHIKTMIKKETKSLVDIGDESQFPNFSRFWKGLLGKFKSNGKLDTEHHECMTEEELEKFFDLLKTLYKLMQLNENDEDFHVYLEKIPEEWKESYHYLAMYGAICNLIYIVSL